MDIGEILKNIWDGSGYHLFGQSGGWQSIVMIIVALFFLYLGIKKQFEPLLLVGIAFGMLLTNLPALDGDKIFHPEWWTGEDAVANGADEIDMVINVGELKSGNTVYVENEIKAVRAACEGKILKVIIETCLLTESEKIAMCEIVTRSGADYIKTSTGFSLGGATFDDIKLFSEHIGSNVKMKAAGGISSLEDAEKFIALGCDRLGTSRIVKLAKGLDASGY